MIPKDEVQRKIAAESDRRALESLSGKKSYAPDPKPVAKPKKGKRGK